MCGCFGKWVWQIIVLLFLALLYAIKQLLYLDVLFLIWNCMRAIRPVQWTLIILTSIIQTLDYLNTQVSEHFTLVLVYMHTLLSNLFIRTFDYPNVLPGPNCMHNRHRVVFLPFPPTFWSSVVFLCLFLPWFNTFSGSSINEINVAENFLSYMYM